MTNNCRMIRKSDVVKQYLTKVSRDTKRRAAEITDGFVFQVIECTYSIDLRDFLKKL